MEWMSRVLCVWGPEHEIKLSFSKQSVESPASLMECLSYPCRWANELDVTRGTTTGRLGDSRDTALQRRNRDRMVPHHPSPGIRFQQQEVSHKKLSGYSHLSLGHLDKSAETFLQTIFQKNGQ